MHFSTVVQSKSWFGPYWQGRSKNSYDDLNTFSSFKRKKNPWLFCPWICSLHPCPNVSDIWCTGCSLNIVFFPENVVIFLNSARSAAALVFYLPDVCTHTATERKQSPEYFKIFEKNTILINTLYILLVPINTRHTIYMHMKSWQTFVHEPQEWLQIVNSQANSRKAGKDCLTTQLSFCFFSKVFIDWIDSLMLIDI